MNLTRGEFCQFSHTTRLKLLKEFGRKILVRKIRMRLVSVYKICDFYVEVYQNLSSHQLEKIEPVRNTNILEIYNALWYLRNLKRLNSVLKRRPYKTLYAHYSSTVMRNFDGVKIWLFSDQHGWQIMQRSLWFCTLTLVYEYEKPVSCAYSLSCSGGQWIVICMDQLNCCSRRMIFLIHTPRWSSNLFLKIIQPRKKTTSSSRLHQWRLLMMVIYFKSIYR